MKVSFIVPPDLINAQPAERTAGCTRVVYQMPNIYELTVAAVIEQQKIHQVSYTDFVYQRKDKSELCAFLRADQADIYMIWAVNLSIDSDIITIGIINQLVPNAYVVIMGPGPTYFTSKCLVNDKVIIVRGEPEETAKELLNNIHYGKDWHNILGISYLHNGKTHNNPARPLIQNLDDLPFPARHLIKSQSYHNAKLKVSPYTTVATSRNCPYHCIYCVPSSLTFAREIEYRRDHGTKPTIGFRSTQNVEEEIKYLHQQGYKAIGFVDDNFIWNEKRTSELCHIMKRYDMVWGCQARVDAITDNIAKMLGESGCRYVDLGVESFDDEILKFIKKGITSQQIYDAISLLKKHHVPVKLNVLIGSSPLETKKTLRHTLHEAKKLDVDQVMFNIVSPFPGTEFYSMCKKNGWLSTPDYVPTDVQRHSILNYPQLSSKQMEKILFWNNISYFLNPHFIAKQIVRFKNISEFKSALKALRIKLFGVPNQN